MTLVKKAIILDPENKWYGLLQADIYEKQYKFKEAAKVYEGFVNRFPNKIDYFLDWAAMLVSSNNYNDAIKVYNLVEEKIGVTEDISLQKQRIWLRLNKLPKAVEEIEKLIAKKPNEIRYYGMIAELYQANGETEEAMNIYKKMLAIDANNPHTRIALAEHYKSIGRYDSSFYELKRAFENTNLSVDRKVKILLPYYFLVDKDTSLKLNAFKLAEILINVHPDEAKGHAVYGDLLFNDNQLKKSREQYRMAIELDSEKFPIWQQVLYIDAELEEYEVLIEETQKAIEYFPNHAVLYYFSSVAKMQLKDYHDAIITIKKGIGLTIDNSSLLSQFYSNLGDAYHKVNVDTASDNAYRKSLKLDPNNSYVLNNFSYYLSLRGENLEEAEKMSFKSNQIEPDNSAFQDTYGWILYQRNDYKESKYWLEKAMENGGDKSAVILEHYGDLMYRVGDSEKAVEYWIKAKELGPGSGNLDKKIANKKM
ncbi:MAG: tetratricopeptide repeat protein [Bacteroidia bacterium]|nr:tetratricopeptide repeat protein [Bacteroidia bacterium]